jgi:hypothetical protein
MHHPDTSERQSAARRHSIRWLLLIVAGIITVFALLLIDLLTSPTLPK